MAMIRALTNKKGLRSGELAERTAQERDEAASRDAEIAALHTRVAALDEEIRLAVVAGALDGQDVGSALAKARTEHRAVVARIEALTERNQTAALVIGELEARHHAALVSENTLQRQRLAEQFNDHAARVRVLLLEAGSLQQQAIQIRNQEGELACAPCVQRAGGLPAETLIEYRPLGPSLANVAQGYEAVDSGNRELARLLRLG